MTLPIDLWVNGTNLKNEPNLKLTSSYGEHGDEQVTFDYTGLPVGLRKAVYLSDPTFGVFWNGYVGLVTPKLFSCPSYVCRGYYKTAGDVPYYENKTFLAGTPAVEMVRNALGKCAHIQDSEQIDDLTFQLAEDSPNFGLQGADDVFNYAQQLTGYMGTPLLWEVTQDRTLPFLPAPSLKTKAADLAPRYRVMLTKNDQFEPPYDADVVYNVGLVQWGNQQYQAATKSGYSAPQLPQNPFVALAIPKVDYSVIPDERHKRVNVSGTVSGIQEVQQLAGYLESRNNVLRPVSATLTIDCNTPIRSVYPAYISENLPHWLVQSNFAIEILNDLRSWGMYGITTFFITEAKYDFTSGKLTLTLGDPILRDTIRLLGSYDVSREYISVKSGVIQLTHRDADVLVQYGTEFPGTTLVPNPDDSTILNNFSAGIPQAISTVDSNTRAAKFDDPNDPFYQPTGNSIDPRIIPDYGTRANFGREADSVGIKGFVEVIPMIALTWSIAFIPPPGSDTIPTDSITIEFYDTYPFTPGSPFATKSISAAQDASGQFTVSPDERHVFPQGGKIGIRVSVAASIANSGFQIAIGGRRLYPALGLNS